ncbi:MAG: FadR/GntR family transcriptional regulator [Suipraeoptans sp.]
MKGCDFEMEHQFLAPIYSTSIVQQVIDRLSQAIIAGELKPGDKIPTEPELAELFKIGRSSIREGIRILIAYGVLEIRRPEGTFVCDDFSAKMINPVLYNIILHQENSYDDLIGLRKMVEYGIMRAIIKQGVTKEDINLVQQKADELTNILTTAPQNTDAILAADIDFHDTLAKLTNNSLIQMINNMIVELTKISREQTIESVVSSGDAQYLTDTHLNIVKALASNDLNEVDKSLDNSYFFWKDLYNK